MRSYPYVRPRFYIHTYEDTEAPERERFHFDLARSSRMSAATSAQATSSKPPDPPKRALFSKPSWSNPKKIKNTDDLFNRSNQSYVGAAEERARRRERKLAKKQKEQTSDHPSDGRAGKRLRLSDDDSNDDDAATFDSEDSSEARNKKLDTDTHRRKHCSSSKGSPPQSLQPKAQITPPAGYNANANPAKSNPLPGSLLKSYDDNCAVGTQEPEIKMIGEIRKAQPQNGGMSSVVLEIQDEEDEEDGILESDNEFAELARKAREKHRRKRLETDISFGSPDTPSTTGDPASQQRCQSIPKPQPPPPPPRDPVIKIFITSKIENTQPLIVNRRLSQRLRDVRLAWCHRQNFSKEFTDKVFLTWRGCKLWDVTTCVRLGIAVDEFDNILLKGQKDITGEEETHIHMEAMTEEILEEHKKSHKAPILNEPLPGEDDVSEVEEKVEKAAKVKIILKAKGYEDFKVSIGAVRCSAYTYPSADLLTNFLCQSSPISTMVNAFRKEHKLGSNKKIILTFDGEKLDPHTKVQETEISDLDFVEVYIK